MGVTAIIGAQFGSEGKGAYIASTAGRFDVAVRTGGPNAGHSFWHGGRVYKMRSIPCTWINPNCALVLGAGAVIDPEVLRREVEETGRGDIRVDHQAAIITEQDREDEEHSALAGMGSTLEGVGYARIKKIKRDAGDSPLARDHTVPTVDTVEYLSGQIQQGAEILLEGTQGSGLSLHHGQWPYVTSSDCNAAQLLADAGIAPAHLAHTILVARTYPIRVGGPSGPMRNERTWEEMGRLPERTTVTNKIRRIGEWDSEVFARAVQLNAPCGIVLTFTDYLDSTLTGATDPGYVLKNRRLQAFIRMVEQEARAPVIAIGTGGKKFEIVPLTPCDHGVAF